MRNLYNISLLPNQNAINSVAILYHDFVEENIDLSNSLIKLKQAINRSDFMQQQDQARWFCQYGIDYSLNPKLFMYAPLNITSAYLSEIFKHYSIKQIYDSLLIVSIKKALLRLRTFMIKRQNCTVLPFFPKVKNTKTINLCLQASA